MTWRPLPSGGSPPPARLTGPLDEVARDLGAPGADVLAVLFSRWEEIAGPVTAAHSKPLWLQRGKLIVAVDDPSRATELRYRANELLSRLADLAGGPVAERLEVRVRAPS